MGFFGNLQVAHLFVFKKSIKKLEKCDIDDEDLEFFIFLMNGYHGFKNKILNKLLEIEKREKRQNKTYLKVHDDLKNSLPKFILDIYSSMHSKDDDFRAYATYVMTKFINDFFSNTNARFTLRIIDQEKNEMKCKITTRDNPPSNIPLSEPNMISQSLKKNKPLIYSENKQFHYDIR